MKMKTVSVDYLLNTRNVPVNVYVDFIPVCAYMYVGIVEIYK